MTGLVCTCGRTADPDEWSCANRGDGGDHVLRLPLPESWDVDAGSDNPFLRFRRMLHTHTEAIGDGLSDDQFVDLVSTLDDRVATVDGRRFAVTPSLCSPGLADAVGADVVLKDETGDVSGSHKARHVGGLMIGLLAREAGGRLPERPPLAIASCGNAALAASVVAAAAGWPITVFVPPDGDPAVLARLADIGADVVTCPRTDLPGDPTYAAFRAAVADGAIPFGCQGPDNGRTIDGGRTLGYELAEQVPDLDRVIVQVGGAALVSGVAQGLSAAATHGPLGRLPVVDTVQAEGCAPLARALVRTRELSGLDAARADRSRVMWPWQPTPHSIASGILDDETYDWFGAVEAMIDTGGDALVVSDRRIREGHELVRIHSDLRPSFTGAAGVAGLLDRRDAGTLAAGETVAVLITGIDRAEEAR